MRHNPDRRRLLGAGIAAFGALATSALFAAPGLAAGQPPEPEVTPNEDLMREHGALRRILLIYEEIDRRAASGKTPMAQLGASAGLIRRFVEDYHEKLEENYIFPAFEKAGKLMDLTAVLRAQHQAGRTITDRLESIVAGKAATARVDTLIRRFLRMYRPHAAREDTVLFPAFPGVVGRKRYEELGDVFEGRERGQFGQHGFEEIVHEVEQIEQQLGIYNLAQFTPRA